MRSVYFQDKTDINSMFKCNLPILKDFNTIQKWKKIGNQAFNGKRGITISLVMMVPDKNLPTNPKAI